LETFEASLHKVRGALVTNSTMEDVSEDVVTVPAYPKEFDLNTVGELLERFSKADEVYQDGIPVVARASGLKQVVDRTYPKMTDVEKEESDQAIEEWRASEEESRRMRREMENRPDLVNPGEGGEPPPPGPNR
jgi:hypothetical protein